MTIIDVNEADFEAEVIERSREVPVVVDFWASWCSPCRQLGPILEKAAEEREGKAVLAKIDTDANQQIAERYGIQSIPAVKAFVDGEVVAEFLGAQPPSQVEKFFDALVPSETQQLLHAGDEASLRRAVELEPTNLQANLALAQLEYRNGDSDSARARLRNVTGDFQADGLLARIELEQSDGNGELSEAFTLIDEAKLEEGLDKLLELLVAADDEDDRERIRKVVVAVLDELGVDHPLARESRRRMAAALY
ncbi:MAG: putative thioredoxin [Solirubrobacteraceae bacterium]|nr:putative thioredoxin [Solirubrobacteraceae bacterium]